MNFKKPILVLFLVIITLFVVGCTHVEVPVENIEVVKEIRIEQPKENTQPASTETEDKKEVPIKEVILNELKPLKSKTYLKDGLKLGKNSFSISDSKVSVFKDDEIYFDGEDYDISEQLDLNLNICYSGSDVCDEDLGSDIAGFFEQETSLVFSQKIEALKWSEIDDENDLRLNLLGSDLRIVKADASTDKITVVGGKSYYLNAGDTIVQDGKEVTLIQTGSGKATISVDGVREVIAENNEERVNGLDIRVEDVSSDDGIEFDSATLILSLKDARESVQTGDEFFGEDKNNPNWEWVVELDENGESYIGISYVAEADDADDRGILADGESLCLPFEFLCLELQQVEGLESDSVKLDFSTKTLNGSAVSVVELNGEFEANNRGLIFDQLSGQFYEKDDGDYEAIGNFAEFNDADGLGIKWNGTSLLVGNSVELQFNASLKDWTLARTNEGINLDSADKDVLTNEGIVIRDPENVVEDDKELEIRYPKEAVEYAILVQWLE